MSQKKPTQQKSSLVLDNKTTTVVAMPREAVKNVTLITDYNEVYQKEYGWIAKGDIDSTLKCILKELVRARLERSRNNV